MDSWGRKDDKGRKFFSGSENLEMDLFSLGVVEPINQKGTTIKWAREESGIMGGNTSVVVKLFASERSQWSSGEGRENEAIDRDCKIEKRG